MIGVNEPAAPNPPDSPSADSSRADSLNARAVEPLVQAPNATVVVPGSKSITNRALATALLAAGTSTLDGFLWSDDTEAMLGVVQSLGATVEATPGNPRVIVAGVGSDLAPGPRDLDVRMSGTTARFATAIAAKAEGPYRIDGAEQMRARPMGSTADALRSLGVQVDGDTLPLTVSRGMIGGAVSIPAYVSSQFASGLLLAAPGLPRGLELTLTGDPQSGEIVSQPYLDMTVAVMRAFGADVNVTKHRYLVPEDSRYTATNYVIEPDASAASYFFAAAALTGGRVRIDGLGSNALQGDVRFVEALAQMGAEVTVAADHVIVQGTDTLDGIEIDMRDISDTAQTLAVLAPFASSPTRVTGIGFIRNKETDRVAAVVNELQRLGVDAVEEEDGFVITPGPISPTEVQTYHDHRMAMSFALIGLRVPGITIANPACVNKTFPTYWDVLDALR